MPVQINEVIIRTAVTSQPAEEAGGQARAVTDTVPRLSEEDVLERVLEIIQESKER